ncbi:MEKHLA domain-containing protein [Saccharopolyspora shandongensis]|uniref:MEKHLA domain-containing protein n=1 Tax=Saccharopolyspora shandongensis TaxID=418495 RepID=UPI00340A4A42
MPPDGTALFRCIEGSFRSLVGLELVPLDGNEDSRERWLYEQAPFGILAHDGGSDPRFVYANRTAQRCFEYSWDEIVGMPSRLSAGPDGQADRDRLLDDTRRQGFTDDYRGVRVAASGRRFWIERVLLWNLLDPDGHRCGQAALIREWRDVT